MLDQLGRCSLLVRQPKADARQIKLFKTNKHWDLVPVFHSHERSLGRWQSYGMTFQYKVQLNLDITNLHISKPALQRAIFFTQQWYMEKNLDITKPRNSKQILPVPWPNVKFSFLHKKIRKEKKKILNQ